MKTKDFPDARVYYPNDEKERKVIEGLVEQGFIDYLHGGYSLNKKGVKVCKELEKKGLI
jgi:predicted transcriptional regulator